MGTLTAAAFVATWLTVVVAVAGAVVVLAIATAVAMFFHERHADRVARHESVRTYYRHHVFAH